MTSPAILRSEVPQEPKPAAGTQAKFDFGSRSFWADRVDPIQYGRAEHGPRGGILKNFERAFCRSRVHVRDGVLKARLDIASDASSRSFWRRADYPSVFHVELSDLLNARPASKKGRADCQGQQSLHSFPRQIPHFPPISSLPLRSSLECAKPVPRSAQCSGGLLFSI